MLTDATIGVTNIVEGLHKRIVHPPLLPSTPIQQLITKIAGFTYNNVRWGTQLVGDGLDKVLGQLDTQLGEVEQSDQREAMTSALNGVLGDYLERNDNPLQIDMQFRLEGKAISIDSNSITETYPNINGKILLMIHGLCMNDIQWTRKAHNHGAALAAELDRTPIYLHYNSGRHISANGRELNERLEALVEHWPVPVEDLFIVAHSMGGLVTRSALHYAKQEEKNWLPQLKKMVFLGTPHHGAAMERAGNYVDVILEAIPYAKPFARLGKIRSAGITDLRYGNLVEEDWQENDRFERVGDQRQTIPLPDQINFYSIAAVIGKAGDSIAHQTIGDGLVNIQSARGQHKDPAKNLHFKDGNTWVAYESGHMDLLNEPEIYTKLKSWLIGTQ